MKRNKQRLIKEVKANLTFISTYLNKKFFYLLPNYQITFQLLKELLDFNCLYLSKLYQQSLMLSSKELIGLKTETDFNLNPDLVPPKSWLLIDHFGGNPTNLDKIREKTDYIIEDISFALGSKWQETNIGSFGLLSLFQLGPNINLFFQPPQAQSLTYPEKYINKDKFPIILLTKRFKLRQKIDIILKKRPQWRLKINEIILEHSQKIGRFIQNLDFYRHQNQLQTHKLYLKLKTNPKLQLATIHQFSQPYFTFFPLKIIDKKKED